MLHINSTELEEILDIKLNKDFRITGISTDTRTIQPNNLFIPLIGDNFNGHDYIKLALEKSNSVSLCNKAELEKRQELKKLENKLVVVENAELAYFKIMSYWRDQFKNIKVIGIGGSVGKTTTKELLRSICEQDGDTVYTKENLNTALAMCMVVNELEENTKYLVCEMGTDTFGEITQEAEIVKPDIGVCLSVTATHAELLGGTISGVAKAESEIVEYFKDKGTVLLNTDDEYVNEMQGLVKSGKVITFGNKNTDIFIKNYSQDKSGIKLDLNILDNIFVPNLWGKGNLYNIMAAVGMAKELKIPDENIRFGLKNFIPVSHRLNFFTYNQNITIQDDSYNANPQSMKQSIEVFNELTGSNRKIYLLGDMRELGDHTVDAHIQLASLITQYKPEYLFYVGDNSELIKERLSNLLKVSTYMNLDSDENLHELYFDINAILQPNDWLLIKGSKGTGIYKIIPEFKK